MTLNRGTVLQGRYRIVSLLGQGGMGAVYRAWDLRLEIPVALKEMLPQPGLDQNTLQGLRTQFRKEAALVAQFDHPHLVNVSDFFEENRNVYLVMNFVEGEDLQAHIARRGALPEKQVLTWAKQLLDALTYIHKQGIIHRDIKPQNVIVRPDGQVILVDFGLVKLWNPNDPRTQTVIRSMGTPGYAPPEQYNPSRGHTDPRSDLYSLAATLYHALTGQAPPTATERMVNPGSLRPIRHLNPGVSPHVEAALLRALALQPQDRFQSAPEMRRALQQPAPQQPQPPPYTPPPVAPPPGQKAPSTSPRRTPPWIWILPAAALLLCLLVGGGSALYLALRPTPEAPSDSSGRATRTSTATVSPTTAVPATPASSPTATPLPPPSTSTSAPTAPPTLPPTSTPFPTSTPLPTATPAPTCPAVTGTFADVWQQYQSRLGCARSGVYSTWAAQEHFEGGAMLWRQDTDGIWVLYNNGTWAGYHNAWQEGDPTYSCPDLAPSQSPPTPLRGFGKLWCSQANVRKRLGNAVDPERGFDAFIQDFEGGTVLRTDGGKTYVVYNDQTWTQ
ncbi:MAG: serine/threonine protein kinase [Anaerolineae bacterium]